MNIGQQPAPIQPTNNSQSLSAGTSKPVINENNQKVATVLKDSFSYLENLVLPENQKENFTREISLLRTQVDEITQKAKDQEFNPKEIEELLECMGKAREIGMNVFQDNKEQINNVFNISYQRLHQETDASSPLGDSISFEEAFDKEKLADFNKKIIGELEQLDSYILPEELPKLKAELQLIYEKMEKIVDASEGDDFTIEEERELDNCVTDASEAYKAYLPPEKEDQIDQILENAIIKGMDEIQNEQDHHELSINETNEKMVQMYEKATKAMDAQLQQLPSEKQATLSNDIRNVLTKMNALVKEAGAKSFSEEEEIRLDGLMSKGIEIYKEYFNGEEVDTMMGDSLEKSALEQDGLADTDVSSDDEV